MGLTLKNKATFEWNDGISNTTISLSPEDDLETIITKLRTVVELARPKGATREQIAMAEKRGYADPANLSSPPAREYAAPSAGGWHKAPETPDRWKGEVEVIKQDPTA